MIRTIAALALLTASAPSHRRLRSEGRYALSSTAPWWEKVTVTVAGDGKAASRAATKSSLDPKRRRGLRRDRQPGGDGRRIRSGATNRT